VRIECANGRFHPPPNLAPRDGVTSSVPDEVDLAGESLRHVARCARAMNLPGQVRRLESRQLRTAGGGLSTGAGNLPPETRRTTACATAAARLDIRHARVRQV